MRTIEWYSEETENNYFNEFSSNIKFGKTYHLIENDKKGYVIYNMGYIEKGAIVAEGKFGDTEMFIKDESNFYITKRTLYFLKIKQRGLSNDANNPEIVYRRYSTTTQVKSIFTYKRKHDLAIEYYKIYTNIFAVLKANIINKKWYKNVFTSNIEGVLELYDENMNDDFIICAFFSLADYLIKSRND
jgi:hypothetical protein